ncbi:MAG: glycosyltransferase [Ignavibacteriae bacterium]|nr:glycosyltransferase [Ignavibacteriota bacterium]
MPTVSVVFPVYNGERYVREAIESILRQTFADFELIVVDDGSNDATPAIIKSFTDSRIRVLTNPRNVGIIATLNRAIRDAEGEFVCRMDADDIAAPERLQVQMEFLRLHPNVAMVGSNVVIIDESGVTIATEELPQSNAEIRSAMFVHNPFAHGSVMLRRDVLNAVGAYDNRFLHNEDYDLWLRIASQFEVANISLPLLKRRVHPESITSAKQTELTGYRVRTLTHAVVHYFRNPLLFVFLIRPVAAYAYRRLKGAMGL